LGRNDEQGIVIMLVAVVMLFVVGAMAALSIDVVTLYTARSEAQLVADGAALAGARVLANSGMTSASDSTVGVAAVPLATAVALQVAASNPVGGRNLNPAGVCPGGEICVSINELASNFVANPHVTVQVQRSDLPTFFARIWGRTTITVKASATAEAYNPSNVPGTSVNPKLPVAPMCVKPWLLPNMDPSGGTTIFSPTTGAITNPALLGWASPSGGGGGPTGRLRTACTNCTQDSAPTAWRYYPGTTDPAGDFPAPSASSVVCPGCTGFTNYQLSIAGCVQRPISCNSTVSIDATPYLSRDTPETRDAVNGLTHSTGNDGDSVDTSPAPPPTGSASFQFLAGEDNPVVLSGALSAGTDIMVSDSLVTVPVINVDSTTTLPLVGFPSVQIIGFVQLFLNPTGAKAATGLIRTRIINLVGCGITITGQPILGNGASPVAVRLISPP
jgi:putative Flp pilus-assembly TadE/G-like protein